MAEELAEEAEENPNFCCSICYGSSRYLLSPDAVSPMSHRSISFTPIGDISFPRGRYRDHP